MRVVFMGSPASVLAPLDRLIQLHKEGTNQLVAIVSQPAKPVGRRGQLQDPPVAQHGKEQGFTVLQPEKAGEESFLKAMQALAPDVIITAAYGQILTDAFLAIPKRATINLHPSLLPQYRGATPVPQALLEGQSETGMSILFTVKKLDAGALIAQERVAIKADETADQLTQRLFSLGAAMLEKTLQTLEDPSFAGLPQDESKVTLCHKIQKEDGKILWQDPAALIYQRFRAYFPWPGSFTFFGDRRVVVEAMGVCPETISLKPGEFYFDKRLRAIVAGTAEGALLLRQFKQAGSKSVDAAAFWNGLKLKDRGQFVTV